MNEDDDHITQVTGSGIGTQRKIARCVAGAADKSYEASKLRVMKSENDMNKCTSARRYYRRSTTDAHCQDTKGKSRNRVTGATDQSRQLSRGEGSKDKIEQCNRVEK